MRVKSVAITCVNHPTVLSPPKLRHRRSAPALLAIGHCRSASDSTLVDFLASPTAFQPPVGESPTHEEGQGIVQDGRPSSPSDQSEFDDVCSYQVSFTWQDRVTDAIKVLKVVQDTDWAEHLARTVAEAKAAKDEEWAKRLAKAVAEAEAAKDAEYEVVCNAKDLSHSNEVQDLEEDHEHTIQDLKSEHAELLRELTEKHAEERQGFARKHALKARELEMRRAQGAKEVKKLKDGICEMENEKMAREKNLVHMTGQRDALSTAFTAMKGQSPPQTITSMEPSHSDKYLHRIQDDNDATSQSEKEENVKATDNVAETGETKSKDPATKRSNPQPHHQPQPSQTPSTPTDLLPRLRLLENENTLLRTDLDRRHEDVQYLISKTDTLRTLLEEDPAKADTYAETLIHKDLIEALKTSLAASHHATQRQKLEVHRLNGQIDLVTAHMETEKLHRVIAVKDKETAWQQNESLLKDLKTPFRKHDVDNAVWSLYHSLADEKTRLEFDIEGYKQSCQQLMREAVELKNHIAVRELCISNCDEEETQVLKDQVSRLKIEKEVLVSELGFQRAQIENGTLGLLSPRCRRDVQECVSGGKDKVVEMLGAGVDGVALEAGGRGGVVLAGGGGEEHGLSWVGTPKSDYGFF